MTLNRWMVSLVLAALLFPAAARAQSKIEVPLSCTRGDAHQAYTGLITMPAAQPAGSILHVRIDSRPSGEISHFGLKYLHDMTTEYLLPEGSTYIDGSAHLISGTGTANVTAGAKVLRSGRKLRVILPGHVDNGSSYIPPSIEFSLHIEASPGAKLHLELSKYQVSIKALIVGELLATCTPEPSPYILATTLVEKP